MISEAEVLEVFKLWANEEALHGKLEDESPESKAQVFMNLLEHVRS